MNKIRRRDVLHDERWNFSVPGWKLARLCGGYDLTTEGLKMTRFFCSAFALAGPV